MFSSLSGAFAQASSSFTSSSDDSSLPEAPQSQQRRDGVITGTVLDQNKDVLQGVRVTLADTTGSALRTAQSGSNGQFEFTGLPAGVYTLNVTAPGMSTFTSPQVSLQGGEAYIVPTVTLAVSGGRTSVTVNGNNEALAEQQLHIAEHQRVVGVIPNFYSAYDWNAPPMLTKQKFELSIRSIIDPVSFLSVAGPCIRQRIRRLQQALRRGHGESRFWRPAGPSRLPFHLSSRPALFL
jgi:hypothetical protein